MQNRHLNTVDVKLGQQAALLILLQKCFRTHPLVDRSGGAEGGVGTASASRAGVASTHPDPGADNDDHKTVITAAIHC